MNVTAIDWLILTGFFIVFLALAIWMNRYTRSVADYLVAGRKIRMWLGMGAGIAGEIGLISIAAMCEQGYRHGFGFLIIGLLNMAVMVPLFGVFGFGIERFRATRAMSVPQYVEMRYSRRLRVLTGMLNSLAGVIQMCAFPIVGAQFLRVLIQAPEWTTLGGLPVQSAWIIMTLLLFCNVLFTYFGGYVTLMVLNFFQMILIVGALYWVLIDAVTGMGLQTLWSRLEASRGLGGVYPFAGDESAYGVTWFAWLTLMSILLQFSYGPYLQKYASMDKPKTVSRSYLIGAVFGNGRTYVIIGLGVAALAAIGPGDMPAGMNETEWGRAITPLFLSRIVPAGLLGVLLAALLFADTSTTNQYLLSWSTSIVNDCIVPFRRHPFSPRAHIAAVRMTVVVLCLVFFVFGVFYKPTLPIWEYLWLCGNVIGGTGIAVLFGMYWKRATTRGAYAAVLTCVVLPVADLLSREVFVRLHPGRPFPLAPERTGLYTYLIAIALLVLVSMMSREKSKFWDLGATVRELNRGSDGAGTRETAS